MDESFESHTLVTLCIPRVNLNAYFQKIFDAEKELIWLLAHILTQKEALKQLIGYSMSHCIEQQISIILFGGAQNHCASSFLLLFVLNKVYFSCQ